MACYAGHFIRDFFINDPINPQKGASIISGSRFEKITQVVYYTNLSITDFNNPFWQQKQMQEGWNKNMVAYFKPSWVSVLD